MEDHDKIAEWLDELNSRLSRFDYTLRREQALNELLIKITELMRAGDFKSAAVLRKEFDKVRNKVADPDKNDFSRDLNTR